MPFHLGRHKFTQNLVPAEVPLLQSKLSSALLSDSQTAQSWLKRQSDHTLPETNKLGISAPITGRLQSAASEKPLSHLPVSLLEARIIDVITQLLLMN